MLGININGMQAHYYICMISGHCGSTHEPYVGFIKLKNTVNLEIFARALFLLKFTNAKFLESKTLVKLQNHSVIY